MSLCSSTRHHVPRGADADSKSTSSGRPGRGGRRPSLARRLARRLRGTSFARRALEGPADLSALRRRPTRREIFGLVLVLLSYPLGWPAVALFGYLAYVWREPLVLAVGGPAIYGFSHLVFFLGVYLAGSVYVKVFLRYAARRGVEKLLGREGEDGGESPRRGSGGAGGAAERRARGDSPGGDGRIAGGKAEKPDPEDKPKGDGAPAS